MFANPLRRLPYKWQLTCVIIGGILVHLTLGTIYTFGNINPYLASYLKARVPDQGFVNYGLMSWLFTATVVGQTCFSAFGGFLEHRLGPKWSTLMGCSIMSFGVFISYFAIEHSFWMVLFTYGIVVGMGTGMGYNPPMACVMKWLPNNRGLGTGMILAGFGLGAFIFNQVQTAYVNPTNYAPDADGFFKQTDLLDRVPTLFFVLAGIYAGMQLIGCMLLMDPPEDLEESAVRTPLLNANDIDDPDVASYTIATSSAASPNDDHLTPRQAMKTVTFWLLWFTMLFNGQAVGFISSYFKVFGQTFIHNDYFLATIGSISSIFNSLGRIIWGHLGDRYSYQGAMVCVTAFLTILMLTVYATSHLGHIAYLIWVSAIFLTFSGTFALFPLAVSKTFGAKYFGVNYGLFFTASAIASVGNSVMSTALLGSFGFHGMFELMAGFSFIAFCITAVIHLSDLESRIGIQPAVNN